MWSGYQPFLPFEGHQTSRSLLEVHFKLILKNNL
jgi:hypothetical protein